ncbi:hypothetical protein DOTSEDRAFT_68712 [Dothistroma septosporum NZE10]|uniref:Dihydroorotate dehydrogenase (fumarate) n=1 Tax=Dothistroma septosporum (strain NZE10 / CBS 128990) TaxID=675120 RepID=N1Q416_DOTSN|nr:hypothetical protein DOTSEDRAFT_68712 [Dothistroma septosporum NZE10]
MPLPLIDPPLVNSSNPWATTTEDLQRIFDCRHTGAVTTRTSLLNGFVHDATIHQYTFFSADEHRVYTGSTKGEAVSAALGGSLNTLGYSPIDLASYLSMLGRVMADSTLPDAVRRSKPFIISVTGSAESVALCYRKIQAVQSIMSNPLCMEINLSCPNIPGKPPPAYSGSSLSEYLQALVKERQSSTTAARVSIGIKTPPYTYHDQFQILIDALLAVSEHQCPIDFITATNTLGSSLVLADAEGKPALKSANDSGIGGMAGAPLHPLALGNVRTVRSMLDEHDSLRSIDIVGVGGVSDRSGFDRMRAVGASVVGVGTALGREGTAVFQKIMDT